MPEGDTIYRAARTLQRALAGKVVTGFESVFPHLTRIHEDAPITGRTVESVSASGKHMLMAFSGDLVLRTHMRMNGSWHIYRPDESWQRPRRDMRIVVATSDFVAVGFSIPVAEFFPARHLARHEELRRLGPELLSEDFDDEEALRRIQARPADTIADVLLNQRVLAGLGNVYKSEVLFACRINPFVTVGDLNLDGIDISSDALDEILTVDDAAVRAQVPQIEEHFAKFGDGLPAELREQFEGLKSRLA
jgi:endonuclease-8